MSSSIQGSVNSYQAPFTTPTSGASAPTRTKQINAASVLEDGEVGSNHNDPWSLGKVIATSAATTHVYLPLFINWIGIVSLIFGGCCSNVSHNHQRFGGHLTLLRCSPWNQSSSECSSRSRPLRTFADCWTVRWEPESGMLNLTLLPVDTT